jgi:hypothetical protein
MLLESEELPAHFSPPLVFILLAVLYVGVTVYVVVELVAVAPAYIDAIGQSTPTSNTFIAALLAYV